MADRGRLRRVVVGIAATSVLVIAPGTAPAQAGLLGDLTGTVAGVTSTTTGLLTGTVGGLLGTGWIYDSSETHLDHVAAVIGADKLYARGVTGRGVGVAIVDTGAVAVKGLGDNIVNGPDLSFESQSDDLRYLDGFGHGTHLAGIIAGNDPPTLLGSDQFRGIAPDSRLTTIKTGTSDGAVDVSQVIAAVDWVVVHRNDDPRNPVRVLNLAYGTDGIQDYRLDPLTHAVENAWRAGIVVVVSGGNNGTDQPRLNNPGYDPFVLTVGASDTRGTTGSLDDLVPDFSSRGEATRRVDLVAPGRSIVSLRDPGSTIDLAHPSARVGSRYFKGSGSSQAAAVTSGAIALLLQSRPDLTPDQVKELLRQSAEPMPDADPAGRGNGELDVFAASLRPTPTAKQGWPRSTGLGSLEQARGSQHVADDGVDLTGERHVLGPFDGAAWAAASAAFAGWSGGRWAGADWAGSCWCGSSWTSKSWASKSWAGQTWASKSWASKSWAGMYWSSKSWASKSWADSSWSSKSWASKSWAGTSWG